MGRYEYLRRRVNRISRRKKTMIWQIVLAAAVLVLGFAGVKIYSVVKENHSQNTAQGENGNAVSAAAVSGNMANIADADVADANIAEADTAEVITVVRPTPEPTQAPRDKAVALTFDDGPSRDNTGTILEVLKTYGAHATFFVLGNRARVDGDILQMELEAGCEIGSHSWDHPQLNELPWSKVKKQVKSTDDIVKKLTNGYRIKLLRPPYGAISDKMRKKMKKPMILWSLDTLDWKYRNAKKVFRKVKKEVKDGDIILMHDIHAETAEAVKQVVPWLLEQGYDILTVSELAERNGKTFEAGKAYCDGIK